MMHVVANAAKKKKKRFASALLPRKIDIFYFPMKYPPICDFEDYIARKGENALCPGRRRLVVLLIVTFFVVEGVRHV